MEAKVDIRKLQLLNDRITQTLEALNQVRLSVRGLGHSMQQGQGQYFGMQQQIPTTQFGINPQQQGWGQQGLSHSGFQQNPYVQQLYQQQNPYLQQQNPYSQQQGQYGMNPFQQQQPWGIQGLGHSGLGQQDVFSLLGQVNPFEGIGGLQHSGLDVTEQRIVEQRANDPSRITQTFPFVFSHGGF